MLAGKDEVLDALQKSFTGWQARLNGMTEAEVCALPASGGWCLKDVIGHLNAWQERSIVRLEAALAGTKPVSPDWMDGLPEEEDFLELFNQRIYERSAAESWETVYARWQTDFARFLQLAALVPEPDLLAQGKYPWLEGYPLMAVLLGSLDHHNEHAE